ncbi:unnamed protein product [Cuscuta campestris]|uniref:OCRE domain-containing protein n=1 Tax=Cuscuta campestris TaxID=132261 RepID=A0A484K325_9ASTE|nr:unnamed protein product [Cuscuta campestris]
MASFVKKHFIFFFILITTLSVSLQIHARESHFFNKVSSSNEQSPSTVIPQQQEPSFTLETENAHGLSGHESGQLSPSSTAFNGQISHSAAGEGIPNKKYLPKNYNSVSYVTVVEDRTDGSTAAGEAGKDQYFTGSKDSNFPMEETSFIGEEVSGGAAGKESKFPADDAMFDDKEFTPATAADNYHYSSAEKESFPENEFPTAAAEDDGNGYYLPNKKSSMPEDKFTETDFNTQQEQTFPTTTSAGEPRFNYNRGVSGNWVQQQGMSDTRFLENGKYFYDVNAEKYVRSPLENAKEYLAGKSRNQFDNNFQEVEEFPEEENLP